MTPDEEVRRGDHARQVLQNEIYVEAYQVIEAKIVNQLALVEIAADRRERLCSLLAAHRKIRQYLEQVMISGQMADQELERQRTMRERVTDKIRGYR